ncbi:hypothetical protein [Flavobacterium cellulosilyticum]|uniref:Uncharacterized protein n=1 Tax=Flavobacterium cellulosilyticum TaxID=2541731 RepID=A0A4R5CKX0_9FLAO|nr:hypothetical protein [Flavobacterium cellulosilyticum]TDD99270.1 hypothetical protein E0F76_00645 [Flavobacterium cellulosilyticum]
MSFLFVKCKVQENKQDFNTLANSYFDDKNALNPLEATQYGQNKYNDQIQLEINDAYRKKQAAFFDKYEFALSTTDEKQLSFEEKNSYENICWKVEIEKELLKYPTNLMPISQFNGTYLEMGRFAGGES